MVLNSETKRIVGGTTLTGVMLRGALAVVRVIYKIVNTVIKSKLK